MGERIIGLVLQVMNSLWKWQECDLLLTDERLIMVRRPNPKPAIEDSLKDTFLHPKQVPDFWAVQVTRMLNHEPNEFQRVMSEYERNGPEAIAAREGSVSVPYSVVEKIGLRHRFVGNELQILFRDQNSRRVKLDIRVIPSDDYMMKKLTIAPEFIERVKTSGIYVHMPKDERIAVEQQVSAADEEYFASVKQLLVSKLPPHLVMNSEGLL
jgi:hypothetical protein